MPVLTDVMRINVELPDQLHTQARILAAKQRKHLRVIVVSAIEHYIHACGMADYAEDERIARADQDERKSNDR